MFIDNKLSMTSSKCLKLNDYAVFFTQFGTETEIIINVSGPVLNIQFITMLRNNNK